MDLLRDNIEVKAIGKLVEMVQDIKIGLDPEVLAQWYAVIENEARSLCPEELRETVQVVRDPVITLKFELKASKRAVPYIVEAIENNLPMMPFATRLYFQRLEEILLREAAGFKASQASTDSS